MPKDSQRTNSAKTGEANFIAGIFQEYFGRKRCGKDKAKSI
jgi:hypothetical protein